MSKRQQRKIKRDAVGIPSRAVRRAKRRLESKESLYKAASNSKNTKAYTQPGSMKCW